MRSTRPPLPVGFRLQADPSTCTSDDGQVLDGGSPWRMLRLTWRGADLAAALLDGAAVAGDVDGALARRLVDAGLAHPLPPVAPSPSMTVVVPVRDRAAELDACLTALGSLSTVVVDDASRDSAAVAGVAARHGARLVSRTTNGGPAAARNTGVGDVDTDLVAFVDSDCLASASALRALARHFGDPVVAAAAPRVLPARGDGRSSSAAGRSPLDMGELPAAVAPGSRVGYVPSTALVVRRQVLVALGGFDESLRYGEDVDLCWRLHDAGWSLRYDPRVGVRHVEPEGWPALARRFHYGTSAGPLARRHPGALRGPSLRGITAPVALAGAHSAGELSLPPEVLRRVVRTAPTATVAGLLRWGTPLWWPPLAAVGTHPRHAASAVVDEAAYGAGVWWSCLRSRTLEPVLPVISARRPTSSP
ncbi:MAG TPA: mycofactocin biosynthesis glycosyltransferase MftF [Mycobacteriales bacterium]|nr:mycofactocin biosynthesis glycosyltransferase MftF [Mycobacteriales bacterium]